MILDKLVLQTRTYLAQQQRKITEHELDKKLELFDPASREHLFFKAVRRLTGEPLKVIAEVKKASPSKGVIRENFDFLEIARIYDSLPVDAVSVLTEEKFFMGSLYYLDEIAKSISKPVLRKDFIIDRYQIKEAIVAGASAVLLIAAILDQNHLKKFMDLCDSFCLDYIVEVHNMDELNKALACEPSVIGINNRDLKSFAVDIHTTEKLKEFIPDSIAVISESGIHTAEHAAYLDSLNIDAVLIGEALMKHDDISGAFNAIFGGIKTQ